MTQGEVFCFVLFFWECLTIEFLWWSRWAEQIIGDICTQCFLYELPDTSSKEWCVCMDELSQVNSDPADGEISLFSKHVPPVETELSWRLFNGSKCLYDVELAAVNMFWYHLFRIKGFYRASMLFSRRSTVIQWEIHHKGGNTETNFCTLRGRKSGKMRFSNKTVWRRMYSGKQEITAADEGSRKNERTGKLNRKSPNQRDAQVNHSIY